MQVKDVDILSSQVSPLPQKIGTLFRLFHHKMPVLEQLLRIAAIMCLVKYIQHDPVRCTKEACNGSMPTDTQVVVTLQTFKVSVDGYIGRRVARLFGIANTYRETKNRLPGLEQSL
jgi:hypothetical protein